MLVGNLFKKKHCLMHDILNINSLLTRGAFPVTFSLFVILQFVRFHPTPPNTNKNIMASPNAMEAKNSPAGPPPPRIFLLSYPRTTSNLFMKILSPETQPNIVGPTNGRYFFLPVMRNIRESNLWSQSHEDWTAEQKSSLQDTLQNCSDELQEFVDSAEANDQGVIVKEHVPFLTDPRALLARVSGGPEPRDDEGYQDMKVKSSSPSPPGCSKLPSNTTFLPNDSLLTWMPAFLIRHPAKAFPSYYRMMTAFREERPEAMQGMESELTAMMTLKWMRKLFDWYASAWEQDSGALRPQFRAPLPGGSKPIVLDADDIISAPEATMGQFCDIVGLDPNKLQFSWDSGAQESIVQERKSTLITRSTLFSSTGVIRSNMSGGIKLDEEVAKWKKEFGEAAATKLEKAVRDSMPDYEYLKAHKLGPTQH